MADPTGSRQPRAEGRAANAPGALAGLRVLDFGRYVAGPYCATLLGLFGAEVIRVERPAGGEDRHIAPVGEPGTGAGWLQTGVNKRSLTLDLSKKASREILARLVATADVAVVNLPPGRLERMGLDEASLRAVRPDLVIAYVTAFGREGPLADSGGFDGIGQAMSGAAAFTGTPGAPAKAAAPYVDFSTGMLAAFGVMAALHARARTGEGQTVDASLLATALTVFGAFLVEESATGIGRSGTGNRVQTSGPSDVVATRDGHVLVHTVGDAMFSRLARLIGRPEWIDDPRFATDGERGRNADPLCEALAAWAGVRTREEALAALNAAGVPAGPVLTTAEALAHPQTAALGLLAAQPVAGAPRAAEVPGAPVRLSATPGGIRSPAPAPGEATAEILAALGYGADTIEDFARDGVV